MTHNPSIQTFEESIRKVLNVAKSEKEIVNQIQPYFQSLLQNEGLLPESYKQPKPNKYSQFLLYKPQDEAFSIVAFVWGPGQTAPIHDHLVWGLVGIYEGTIEETRYRKISNDESEVGFNLEVVETVIAKTKDISFVYPPNADIHSVRNPFNDIAITIHIYGTDIGKQKRNRYASETYAMKPIVTSHENEVPIYHM
ncbi:cysteine dioxygenase family protein [Peribacillus frigoritolerans]|uniref:Cysteine dioxygenase family protein n=1 Tax=Peribacillus frigoritolerans TaxID=450367 RepID=A0AAJ1QIK1_9BACI|nr:cysteine dioxygenase family protein [Peribacillus frigoritolerans]MDM5281900.1 cysteine dioxygenase family protein [Peribacillus frigoritolerans]